MDKKPAEYRTVIDLYKDGRITAAERDRLLDALGYDIDGNRTVKAAVDEAAEDEYLNNFDLDAFDGDDDDDFFDDDDDDYDFFDDKDAELKEYGKRLEAKLTRLSEKINAAVQKGMGSAGEALNKAERAIAAAAARATGASVDDNGTVVKKKRTDSTVPYDKIHITVKYVDDECANRISEYGANKDRLKTQCEKFMDYETYTVLCELLSEEFTGVYKRITDDIVFKFVAKGD